MSRYDKYSMSKKDDFITVNTLNVLIKELLAENISDTLKIKGEVSNLKFSSGSTFFTLKDQQSEISVIAWRTSFDIQNGDDVFVTGFLSCYPKQGRYNINAVKAEKIGIGNIFEAYEKLKKNFEAKGLFSKKRQFPETINSIGIVSAYSGDALKDILHVLQENSFHGNVYVKNCFAQGKFCPNSVKDGIEYFNTQDDKVDLIVISRGGGSLEDLMGFSSEVVVKAIYASDIFTVSAVGHQNDIMLSDLTADHRSSTPTKAAEDITIVGKKIRQEFEICKEFVTKLKLLINSKILECQRKMDGNKTLLTALSSSKIIENELNMLKGLKYTIYNKLKSKIDNISHKLDSLKLQSQSFGITNTFNKGFSMIYTKDGKLIKSAKEFKELRVAKQKLKFIFADGEVIL